MPFVTEQAVRAEADLRNFDELPSALINEAIERAHHQILEQTTLTESSPLTPSITESEVLLSLSFILQRQSISASANAQSAQMPGLKVDDHRHAKRLRRAANRLRRQAWGLLRPYWNTAAPPPLTLAEGGVE